MPDDELTQKILRIVADTQRRDAATINIDSTFEELAIDSMDAVNIVFAVENEFNINVPDDDMRSLKSIRDVVTGVERLLAARPS